MTPEAKTERVLSAEKSLAQRVFAEPFFQFLVLGGMTFGAYALVGTGSDGASTEEIVVDEPFVRAIKEGWSAKRFREPTAEELRSEIHNRVREQILYREGVARGLAEDDVIIVRRVAQKMEFLASEMVEVPEPTKSDVKAFFEEHEDSFQARAQVSFSQVFFSKIGKGGLAEEAATELAERLRRQELGFEDALRDADPNMRAATQRRVDEAQVQGVFGKLFASQVMKLEKVGEFSVLASEFGWHVVRLDALASRKKIPLDAIYGKVRAQLQEKRRELAVAKFYEELKAHYRLRIEGVNVSGLSSEDL